ncbi:MAG: glutathione peroxidase [Bacteroidales bacterium]|nr:glutathione peroxidase [Bacteroidales bacterium]MCF8404029.1 glutathione peroxidase [Bacteroidales bacterium]
MFIALISVAIFGKMQAQQMNFHDFKAETIDGKMLDFSTFKGKKVLVVNTASKCGFTPQYKDLELLYQEYGGENFTIVGFPANNFLRQEPGTNEEIKSFCEINYGVTFQMMAKISVKGDSISPVYKWLTKKAENGVMDSKVSWNFQKYMIDENGNLVDYVKPQKSPTTDKIVNWIKG